MGKKKKERIIYVDDGRTVADMSGVQSGISGRRRGFGQRSAGFKEVWKTYWGAVKVMLLPMLAFICGLGIIYLLMTLIFQWM